MLRVLLALVFLAAGLLHLIVPGPFLEITPDWVPWPERVVRLTGLAEITGAVGLMTRALRKAAGVGLAVYAVCVFPANIEHARASLAESEAVLGLWYHAPRLLFQPAIIWMCLWAGTVIDWPFRR